jgi:RNA polymerase sigma-70 factor (ECF subfamily)
VRQARAGDRDAFGRLVRAHLPAAHAVAAGVLGNGDDADDVCQDAFVTALERLDSCRPEEKFRPWLLTIVRNRALDLRRRKRVRAAAPLAESETGAPASPSVSPLRAAEQANARDHLAAALSTLTDVRRDVLLMHDLEGWTHPEIAEHLGLAVGTVRAHLFWARRGLRAKLSGELRGDDNAG